MPEEASNLEDGQQKVSATGAAVESSAMVETDWKAKFREALASSDSYNQSALRPAWSRNYRAFNNRHVSGSKYESPQYKKRSRLFRPKTRMAVRKNDAAAAAALFSTSQIVNITAERSTDRLQVMTADFLMADFNYRFDRSTSMTGPNWFLTTMGARQDVQLAGICVSKQYWEFEEEPYEVLVEVEEPEIDPATGAPIADPHPTDPLAAPTPRMKVTQKIETRKRIIADRPMVDNLPPENAFIDSTGDWRDPIQDGGHFIAAYPMRKGDIENMIKRNSSRPTVGGRAWRTDIDLKNIGANSNARETETVRRSRDGTGVDRYESRHTTKDSSILWAYEVFYRYDGTDWTWWMLGEQIMLSEPLPVRDCYPEQKGMRPYVRGVGELETHKTHPTAPVETWLPLQQEMNDLTNLQLDARKMAISPITKVVRGRNVDLRQVANRGPDSHIMVMKEDDVTFDRSPGPDGGADQSLAALNVDFDELSGSFSNSSVQTNRQLNDTVGGMKLMAGSSNAITEFDLRVWSETWLEPVVRQIVNCIQFYESDATIIAIAGEQAGLLQELSTEASQSSLDMPAPQAPSEPTITLPQVIGQLDSAIVSVKVDIGLGAAPPEQRMQRFMAGVKMTMEAGQLLAAEKIMPNGPAMMREGWGLLGYKDADKFFKRMPQEMIDAQNAPPPEMQAKQAEMAAKQQEQAAKQSEEQVRRQQDMEDREAERAMKAQERAWKHEDRQKEVALREQETTAKHQREMSAGLVEKGLPPDYSAESLTAMNTQQFEQLSAIIGEMQASQGEQMNMLAQSIAQQTRATMQVMEQIARMISAPKRTELILGKDGKPVASETTTMMQ